MANTAIILTPENGIFAPSLPDVPVNSGDTVTFSTSDGSTAYLFFSPGAAGILSPSPINPVAVSAETFTFTSSNPGAYSVYFGTTANASVPDFPSESIALLLVGVDPSTVVFGVFNNGTKGR